MTPERWREVERLCDAALERDSKQRAAFLAASCGDDAALRCEVESLLALDARADHFMEASPLKVNVEMLSPIARAFRHHASFVPGQLAGRVFGVYEIKTLIAAGGMGEVYRAVDTRLNRTVAIKTLPEHLANDPERRERFKREATIISSLNHPHICTLYDVGTEDGIAFLVMEHIDGETLQTRLARGRLSLPHVIEFAIQMCDALDRAHRRGVIHRDLKPANVMLTASGVKLLDFGLATWRPPAGTVLEPSTPNGAERLTAVGTIAGTLQYLSPEQLEGKQPDVRTDIFAFGALVYEMATGHPTFQGGSQAELIGANPEGRTDADHRARTRDAGDVRPVDLEMPVQGSRRPLADGERPAVRTAIEHVDASRSRHPCGTVEKPFAPGGTRSLDRGRRRGRRSRLAVGRER